MHVLLSLGEFHTVLQVLRDLYHPDTASLFASACLEKNLLFINPSSSSSSANTSTSQETQQSQPQPQPQPQLTPQEQKEQEEKDREMARELLRNSARLSSEVLTSSQGLLDPSSLRALLENVYLSSCAIFYYFSILFYILHFLISGIYYEYATMLQQVACTSGALYYLAKSGRVNRLSATNK